MKYLKRATGIFLTFCLIAALFTCLTAVNSGAASSGKMFVLTCNQNNVKIEYLSGESNKLVPGEAYVLKAKYVSDYGYDAGKLYNMFALWSCESNGGNTSFFRHMENFTERYESETSTYIAEFNATAGGSDPKIVEGKNVYFKMRFADRNGDGAVRNCTVYLANISLIRVSTGEDLLADVPIDEEHITVAQITSHHGLWRIYPETNIKLKSKADIFGVEGAAGDINGDGFANNKDLTCLFQYLSGWDVAVKNGAVDVNGDESVDNKDLTRLFQYLSGWSVRIYSDDPSGGYGQQEDPSDKYTNSSGYYAKKTFTGGATAEAQELKNKIMNSANTEEIYNITGKKYYISKNTPLSSIPETLNSGDAVLFERGGVWRVNPNPVELVVPDGVIFGAYGEGDKPTFYGSAKNYAAEGVWTSAGENLWKTSLKGGNAGIIVFDNAYALGVLKWTKDEVAENYDFYTDDSKEILYMYYNKGNPAADFKSIEIGQKRNLCDLADNCTVNNICFKYGGLHGLTASNLTAVCISNCEIAYIGGAYNTSRLGNGVELGLTAANCRVKNCYVRECYDAGHTFQCWEGTGSFQSINFSNNLIENCNYSIEFFTTNVSDKIKDIYLMNNICRGAGYGWSYDEREGYGQDTSSIGCYRTSHIRVSSGTQYRYTNLSEFYITGNIFDTAKGALIYWWWNDSDNTNLLDVYDGLHISGNTLYQASRSGDDRIIQFKNESGILGSSTYSVREALKLFESTDTPAKLNESKYLLDERVISTY